MCDSLVFGENLLLEMKSRMVRSDPNWNFETFVWNVVIRFD